MFRARADAAIAAGTDPGLAGRQALRRSNALIGIAGAIGAFGGLAVNIAFRESFLHNKNGDAAYIAFVITYLLMAAVTWLVYLQPRRIQIATREEVRAARALNSAPRPARSIAVRGTVAGTARGTLQGALTGATVTLIDPQGHEIARGLTGSGGKFELRAPEDQRYVLVAGAPGYAALTVLIAGDGERHHVVLPEACDCS
jgi:hypothetical protein